MSDSSKTVKVTILEKEYLVACPDHEREALQTSARHLDKTMRDIRASGKIHGLERIAVMAALNITHEYLQKNQLHSGSQEVALGLATKIDKVLQDIS